MTIFTQSTNCPDVVRIVSGSVKRKIKLSTIYDGNTVANENYMADLNTVNYNMLLRSSAAHAANPVSPASPPGKHRGKVSFNEGGAPADSGPSAAPFAKEALPADI